MTDRADRPAGFAITRDLLEADRLRVMLRERDPELAILHDDALERSIADTLAHAPADAAREDGVWIFGYGSLPWNPCIEVAERARVRVNGFHRDFCIDDTEGRGSPENPGLTLALAPGGACNAIGLRVPARHLHRELLLLWRREMVTGVYQPRWVRMRAVDGVISGIAFVINRAHHQYAGRLSAEEVAERIARAEGPLGPGREYLHRTVEQLDHDGIHDRHLHHLRALVQRRERAV